MINLNDKLHRGQLWKNKRDQSIIEIVRVKNDVILSKNAFGGGKGHHIKKKDLFTYWERV